MTKLLIAVVLAGLVASTYVFTYKYGEHDGVLDTTKAWDAENDSRDEAYRKLEKENTALQAAHTAKQNELEKQLDEASANYASSLQLVHNEFANRLLSSETRAGVYQRQARGSATEQERLARHAAELDRSLEEGRALVRELGETVKQRDRVIYTLGQVILNDRTLLTGETNGY